jgi:hypothetical protein
MRKQLSEDDIKRIFSIRKQKKPKILQVKIVKPIIMNPKKIDKTIRKLATAIKKNGALANQKYKTFPYWDIEATRAEIKWEYPHLIVLTDVTPDTDISIKLLKVELDPGWPVFKRVMRKMIGMTGYGLLLCPAVNRFEKFIKAYKTVAKTEKIVTDGIYLGLTSDVLMQGILGPTFTSLSGSRVQFHPRETPVQGAAQ